MEVKIILFDPKFKKHIDTLVLIKKWMKQLDDEQNVFYPENMVKVMNRDHEIILSGMIHDPINNPLFFIFYEKKICGFISLLKSYLFPETIHIVEFFILEKYRNKGIGSLVMNEVEDWIKITYKSNIRFIQLAYMGENIIADKLYKKHGFKPLVVEAQKEI